MAVSHLIYSSILSFKSNIGFNLFIVSTLQAKRDPYRFRFPIEMRFVDPNVDHLMYVVCTSV